MLRCSVVVFTLLTLYFSLTLNVSSEEKSQPKIKIRHSRLLLEGEKRYMDNIKQWEKRYVGDRRKEDKELRRYKGWDKVYAGGESEKEFFEREKEALYRFTSLQKNIENEEEGGEKLAVIIEDENVLSGMSNAKVDIESKEKLNLKKKKRKKIPIPKVILAVIIEDENVLSGMSNAKVDIESKEKLNLKKKERKKIPIPKVIIEE